MGKDFAPDSRCLGGASRIREEWCNMSRKIATARPEVSPYMLTKVSPCGLDVKHICTVDSNKVSSATAHHGNRQGRYMSRRLRPGAGTSTACIVETASLS
eukprot:jgi/Ulvmu1/8611/UM046_0009.1